jgi:hypothetical protein
VALEEEPEIIFFTFSAGFGDYSKKIWFFYLLRMHRKILARDPFSHPDFPSKHLLMHQSRLIYKSEVKKQ